MAQLRCDRLTLGYDRVIRRDLSFEVEAGNYLFILGENGAGKSTLMKTILGLQAPVSGQVVWGDGLTPGQIGYLPQQSRAQRDFPASVQEVVRSGCLGQGRLRPFYTREEKRRAEEAMERMGITGLSGRCYRELSGGQQQRVLLARALCAAEKILLADEPVTGLDPAASEELYHVMDRLNREDGMTVIMISHDPAAALRYASHILYLGDPDFFGSREDFLATETGRIFAERRDRTC